MCQLGDSLEHVVHLLATNRILSAPLLNDNQECIGFVDMLDICAFVVEAAGDILDGLPGHSTLDLKKTLVRQVSPNLRSNKVKVCLSMCELYARH